jgi:hypothetical protein
MKRLVKWFEMNFGWFFLNGRKQAAWAEYLRKKYGKEEIKPQKKIIVSLLPKCLICESDMSELRMNKPFCDECLGTLKKLIIKKNGKRN